MLKRLIKPLIASQRGSTVTEYALVASLIAVALGSSIMALGDGVESQYDYVEDEYAAAAN